MFDARYFDGITAGSKPVLVSFTEDAVHIDSPTVRDRWDTTTIEATLSPDGSLNLSQPDLGEGRLLVAPDRRHAHHFRNIRRARRSRKGGASRAAKMLLQFGTAISLILFIIFWVGPNVAERLAPFVPPETEIALGQRTADLLGPHRLGGRWCHDDAALASLQRMAERIGVHDVAHVPIEFRLIDVRMPNALALPGGIVIFTSGILRMAPNPDAIAGVLAHEVGHVVNRDGLRQFLRAAGTAGLFSILVGDVTGGALIAILSDQLLSASYSRGAERQADAFAIEHLVQAGVSTEPMAQLFERFASLEPDSPAFASHISTHPDTAERIVAIRSGANDVEPHGYQTMPREEWRHLLMVCPGT